MQLDSQFKEVQETRASQNLNPIELDFIGLKTCMPIIHIYSFMMFDLMQKLDKCRPE